LESYFNQELNRVIRYQQNLSVLMLDIDHFKRINDLYGHNAGDEVLKKIAEHLQEQIRDVDIAARYGGEEFVILMPETDKDTAYMVATRLKESIAQINYSRPEFKVTVSIGIASAPKDGTTAQELLKQADQAMYLAKRNGKNRVEMVV